MARRVWLLALLAAAACNKGTEQVPYVDVPVPDVRADVSGPNAFGAYANLASRAEQRAELGLDARDTPGNRERALREVGPLLPEVSSATQSPCVFLFDPVGPFDERPHHTGWLHLGRALVWRVEQAVEERDWDAAAHWTVVAMCFGADLAGGAVSDATLGYGVMDGVRRALAPHVLTMPLPALRTLESGLRRALARFPSADTTIDHEAALMFVAVRDLQGAHKDGKTDEFGKKLYGASREAVTEFGAMQGAERSAFVQSLVDEADAVVRQLRELAAAPGAKRGTLSVQTTGEARTLAEHFFTAGEPWLTKRDETLARTRLFMLTAYVVRALNETGAAPADLSALTGELTTDPYTGMKMGYLPVGRDFIVYSYGIDGKDDRGDTDAAREKPDLLLEG